MTDLASLDIYPIPLGRMFRADWVPLKFGDLEATDLRAKTSNAAYGVWFALFQKSLDQTPPGTLPLDEDVLAHLAGFGRDVEGWRAVHAEGALRGWGKVRCLPEGADGEGDPGEVRLAHPLVQSMVETSVTWLDSTREKNRRAGHRSRLSELRRTMRERCGAHAGLTQRDDFVQAVFDRLKARGDKWTARNVRAAMDFVSVELDGVPEDNARVLASIADKMRARPPS